MITEAFAPHVIRHQVMENCPGVSEKVLEEFLTRTAAMDGVPYRVFLYDEESMEYQGSGLLARCPLLDISICHEGDTINGWTSLRINGVLIEEESLTYKD